MKKLIKTYDFCSVQKFRWHVSSVTVLELYEYNLKVS